MDQDVKTNSEKKPMVFDDNIIKLNQQFLKHVVKTTYSEQKKDIIICVLEPGRHYSSITWDTPFFTSVIFKDIQKQGIINNLDHLMCYNTNRNVPANMVIALMECIRQIMTPGKVYMVDEHPDIRHKCKIIFTPCPTPQSGNRKI
jgi:hypothetical protein